MDGKVFLLMLLRMHGAVLMRFLGLWGMPALVILGLECSFLGMFLLECQLDFGCILSAGWVMILRKCVQFPEPSLSCMWAPYYVIYLVIL